MRGFGTLLLNRMSPSNPSLQGSGNLAEEESGRLSEPMGMDEHKNPKEIRTSKQDGSAYELTETDAACTDCMGLHQMGA